MGNIDLSKMGLSGKMGPIVAYVVNGKQRFRTFTEPRNPKTPKQTAHRSRFGFVSKMVSPLYAQIKLGYKNDNLVYGTVCGKVNREAVISKYSDLKIDYSKIQIAEGKLQPLSTMTLQIDEITNTVTFNWDYETDSKVKFAKANDRVNIVCFNEALPKEIFRKSPNNRVDGKAIVELPKHWNASEAHFWLYVSSWDTMLNSDSVYLTYSRI
ncbi:MAG: hypothetical protein ITF98_08225 [Fermentimonas sp.]|nr:hypothetical protein [Fermentimonas sp.]